MDKIKYTKKENSRFIQAIKERNNNNEDKAIEILKELLHDRPNSTEFILTLGGIYFNMGNYRSSLRLFKRATSLNPKSSLASLGYYHSLWELGYINAGLKEIDRFLEKSYLQDYLEIIKELFEKKTT